MTGTGAAADDGGLLARFRGSSLTVKLTMLGAVVTALVITGAFWALDTQTRRSARALFEQELRRHQATLLALQSQNLAQLVASTGLMTQAPTLRGALQTYRAEANLGEQNPALVRTVEHELARLLRGSGRDLVIVTNERGIVFASAAIEGIRPTVAPGGDISALEAVRQVLSPTAPADSGHFGVLRDGVRAYQIFVYPLVLDGFTIGSLLLGEGLDAGLVASAQAAFDGHVLVTAGETLLAGDARDSALAGALAAADAPSDGVRTVRSGGNDFVAAPLSLGRTQLAEPVTLWLLQPLDSAVESLTGPLRRDFFLYGTLAVVLAAVGAAMASRSVLRPFHDFVRFLRAGSGDDGVETARARFTGDVSSAEIRALSDSFDQLMQSIEAKQRELIQRTTELTAANAVLSDEIQERERVEHALLERNEQLRQSQKLEAVGTLAGGIAHDFNNLLTAMSGFTQLALMNSEPNSAVANDLRQVVQAADRAGHLTKQLLAFSRKQVLRPSLVDIGEVVDGVAPLLDRLLGGHITVSLRIDGDLSRVVADRGQLEQVIMNLAINARDAMPRGGTLTIGATENDGRVIITVTDTGTGIPDELLPRIFEPFFTTKEPGKGTGLGLSTVYGIIAQSGGTIEVDSRVGKGTTFRIALPVAAPDALFPAAEKAEDDLPRGSETVLLVEDDPAVRSLARRTLERCGYTVVPAADPVEALRLVPGTRIDVILSDMLMPHMSGPEMVERYLVDHPAPVIVFMSGYADDDMMANSRAIRSAFIRKPFTPAQLACTVRSAIDQSMRTPTVAI